MRTEVLEERASPRVSSAAGAQSHRPDVVLAARVLRSPPAIMALQRAAGNQAVAAVLAGSPRTLARCPSCGGTCGQQHERLEDEQPQRMLARFATTAVEPEVSEMIAWIDAELASLTAAGEVGAALETAGTAATAEAAATAMTEAAAALAATETAAEGAAAATTVIAAGAASEAVPVVGWVVGSLLIAGGAMALAYYAYRRTYTPPTQANTKPAAPVMPDWMRGSGPQAVRWRECTELHEAYTKNKNDAASYEKRMKELRARLANRRTATAEDRQEFCRLLDERLRLLKEVDRGRARYIERGCDEFDWTGKPLTELERRSKHEDARRKLDAHIKNLYEERDNLCGPGRVNGRRRSTRP